MKAIFLLPLIVSCLQFNEQVEVKKPNPGNNLTRPLKFNSPAGALDTREYISVDLSKIKKSHPSSSTIIIFNKTKSVQLTLAKNDLKKYNKINIRKTKDQYMAKVIEGEKTKIYTLKRISDSLSI